MQYISKGSRDAQSDFTPSLSQCMSSQWEKSAGRYLMCLEMTGCFYVACDLINNKEEMDLQPFLSYICRVIQFPWLFCTAAPWLLHRLKLLNKKNGFEFFKRWARPSEILCGPISQVPLCFTADCHGDDAQAVLGLGLYGVPSFPSERFIRFHYLAAESTSASDTYLARLFLSLFSPSIFILCSLWWTMGRYWFPFWRCLTPIERSAGPVIQFAL